MAVAGDSSYFAGGLLEVIAADAIVNFNKANVTLPLVSLRGEPKADQITFTAWNAGTNVLGSADVTATTEGNQIGATALDSEKKTITLDSYSVRVPIYDEALLSNAGDVEGNIGELVGNALAAKVDALVNANYDNFSNSVGTSTAALTLDNLFDALKTLKNNSAIGFPNAVLYGSQIWGTYGVLNDVVTNADYAGGVAQDEGVKTGFVTKIAGINIYDSPEFTETSNAIKGGVFVSGAVGFGYAGELLGVEKFRQGDYLRTDYIGKGFWGTTEIIDGWGVEIHTKTS